MKYVEEIQEILNNCSYLIELHNTIVFTNSCPEGPRSSYRRGIFNHVRTVFDSEFINKLKQYIVIFDHLLITFNIFLYVDLHTY